MPPLSYLRNYPLSVFSPPRVGFIAPCPAVMPDYVLTCEILRVGTQFLSAVSHGGEIPRRCPEERRKNAREGRWREAIPIGNFNTWKRRCLCRKAPTRLAWNLNSGRLTLRLRTECAVKGCLEWVSGMRLQVLADERLNALLARWLARVFFG